MKNIFLIVSLLISALPMHAQFAQIWRGAPASSGCYTPSLGLDVLNSQLYVCGQSGGWKALTSGVGSVTNSDGSLNITSTSGDVVASLNDGHANTFTANQTISSSYKLTFGSATVGVSLSNVIAYGAGSIQVNDAGSGLFVFNASEADGGIGDGAFFIPDNAPLVWAAPASTPSSSVGALTWVKTGTISLDTTGDGSGSGWLMVSAIGSGVSGNTDLRGHITLSSGSGSYTFTKTYTTAPTCTASDTTALALVKTTTTNTTLTLTGTGSDVIAYVCAD